MSWRPKAVVAAMVAAMAAPFTTLPMPNRLRYGGVWQGRSRVARPFMITMVHKSGVAPPKKSHRQPGATRFRFVHTYQKRKAPATQQEHARVFRAQAKRNRKRMRNLGMVA